MLLRLLSNHFWEDCSKSWKTWKIQHNRVVSSSQATSATGTVHLPKSSINILTQTGSTMSSQTVSHPCTVLPNLREHHLRWRRLVLNPRVSKILSAQRNRFQQTHGKFLTCCKGGSILSLRILLMTMPSFKRFRLGTGVVVYPTWHSHWIWPSCQIRSLIRVSPKPFRRSLGTSSQKTSSKLEIFWRQIPGERSSQYGRHPLSRSNTHEIKTAEGNKTRS